MVPPLMPMQKPSRKPRVGTGGPPVVLDEVRSSWPGLEVRTSTQDISRPTDWRVREGRHVVIVHLSGRMDELETELDGRGGSSGPATPGEVWTVPAGSPYASYATGGTIQFAVLSIPPGGVDGGGGPRTIAALAGARDETFSGLVRQLVRAASGADDVSRMQAETLAHAVTRHVVRAYGTDPPSAPRGDDPQLVLTTHESRLLREFVADHLGSRLSLGRLAALVGMTTHQLLVAFRAAFGTTPSQYVITQRLRRAQWHLLHSRLDITAIALTTGFSSHSHLTSAFTRRFGYPPQRFRENYASPIRGTATPDHHPDQSEPGTGRHELDRL